MGYGERGLDPAARERFTQVYEQFYPAVLAYCARRVDRSDAEDVTHEVFATLWRHVDDFDADTPLPWLYSVAYGAIRNRWKSTRRLRSLRERVRSSSVHPRTATDGPDAIVIRREQDAAVIAALDRLRPRDREVLMLAVWEELTASEIALVVGCSPTAAQQRVHRAKRRLAHALQPLVRADALSPDVHRSGGELA